MVEKFKEKLIIHYPRNIVTNVYKRVIIKLDDDRYITETYYREKDIGKCFMSKSVYNGEQIEKLIDNYLKEYNIEKTIYYK